MSAEAVVSPPCLDQGDVLAGSSPVPPVSFLGVVLRCSEDELTATLFEGTVDRMEPVCGSRVLGVGAPQDLVTMTDEQLRGLVTYVIVVRGMKRVRAWVDTLGEDLDDVDVAHLAACRARVRRVFGLDAGARVARGRSCAVRVAA